MNKYVTTKLKYPTKKALGKLRRRKSTETITLERLFGSEFPKFGASLGAGFSSTTGALSKVRRAKSVG